MINEILKTKPANERATFKGQEIARIVPLGKTIRPNYEIQLVEIKAIEKGVEVYVRAWKNGKQIGFGKDGSVDMERFLIFNPPFLVDDPNGEIVWSGIGAGNILRERKLREDPQEALLQDLEHTLSVMKNIHSDENIVRGKKGNTTSTFYSDASPETNTTDGRISSVGATWAAAQSAVTGTNAIDTEDVLVDMVWVRTTDPFIKRAFFYFNTSSIAATDTIDSATFSTYTEGVGDNADNDGDDFIAIVQTQGNNIVSDTVLNNADFDLAGDAIDNPTEGHDVGGRIDLGSAATTAYNNITFNAIGRGWIARSGEAKPTGGTTGITYLAMREGHDVIDSASVGANSWQSYFSDQGSTKRPKLVVEHSVASTFTPTVMIF